MFDENARKTMSTIVFFTYIIIIAININIKAGDCFKFCVNSKI